MRKVIFMQVLTDNAKTQFNGLYDENGLPVTIELEREEIGVVMTAIRNELSEEEKEQICEEYDDCDDCPLSELCEEEFEDECKDIICNGDCASCPFNEIED